MSEKYNSRIVRQAKENNVDLKLSFESAQTFTNILKKVLTDELESAILKSESEENIKCSDFVAAQANLLGYRKGLRYALSLLNNQG